MKTKNPTNIPAILSTLWIFILFNMIFRDLHQLAHPGYLEEALVGVSDQVLLAAGIVLEIQIMMVLLPRILPYRFNRWVNIIVAILFMGIMLSFGVTDLDDIWFLTVEVIALVSIIWTAWRWHPTDSDVPNSLNIASP